MHPAHVPLSLRINESGHEQYDVVTDIPRIRKVTTQSCDPFISDLLVLPILGMAAAGTKAGQINAICIRTDRYTRGPLLSLRAVSLHVPHRDAASFKSREPSTGISSPIRYFRVFGIRAIAAKHLIRQFGACFGGDHTHAPPSLPEHSPSGFEFDRAGIAKCRVHACLVTPEQLGMVSSLTERIVSKRWQQHC